MYRDNRIGDIIKVRTLMDTPACLIVLGALMAAIVTFFWAAGRAQKKLEQAQEAMFHPDPPKPDRG